MLLLAERLRYFAAYSAVSIALLLWSVYSSLTRSVNLITFVVAFTNGYHLRILLNAIVLSFIAGNLLILKLFFGELRLIEHEHLSRELPLYSMSLLLTLAINDGNAIFNCFLLGMCASCKIFHILFMDRLDQVHILLLNNYSRHNYTKTDVLRKFLGSRYFASILVFIAANIIFAKYLVYDIFQGINSISCVLYGFQFAVIALDSVGYVLKLLTGIYEIVMYMVDPGDLDWSTAGNSSDGGLPYDEMPDEDDDDYDGADRIWEAKPYFTKGIDIAVSALKALLHIWFIYILTFSSGLSLPLSMLQGTYASVRRVYTEIKQLSAFIESSRRLDTQLRDAAQQDLESGDVLCIICREDMCAAELFSALHQKPLPPRKTPKKLWCNHILHLGCLKEWLERSDTCPLCRTKVFGQATPIPTPPPVRQIPQETNNDVENGEDAPPPAEVDPRVDEFAQFLNLRTTEQVTADNLHHDVDTPVPNPMPTPTQPQSQTETRAQHMQDRQYQRITLPRLALIPPDWILLPLERVESDPGIEPGPRSQYLVCISESLRGTLQVKHRPQNRIIPMSSPSP